MTVIDAVYALWAGTHPDDRPHCMWVMDRGTWRALARSVGWPDLEDREPGPGARLLGLPVVVDHRADGLHLHLVRDGRRRRLAGATAVTVLVDDNPVGPVAAHPRTGAIDDEFGWNDAQVVTFPTDERGVASEGG